MISKRADCVNLQLFRHGALHHQCVGIVETKFFGHPDTKFLEVLPHIGGRDRWRFQDFFGNRARVLRIERYFTTPYCFPENDASSHSLTVFCRNARIPQCTLGDLS